MNKIYFGFSYANMFFFSVTLQDCRDFYCLTHNQHKLLGSGLLFIYYLAYLGSWGRWGVVDSGLMILYL
jgi:hypothetical protein